MKINKLMFTFAVPVYDTEEFLERCLDSISAQSGEDFEVVVVDDCSPGNCKEIVEKYDQRFRYVRHDKNRSLLQARLTGVSEAKGEYIVPVDSDNYVGRELLKELKAEIVAAENPDVIVYQTMIDKGGEKTAAWHNHAFGRCTCRAMLAELFNGKAFWPVCGKCFRTDVYRKAVAGLGISHDFYLNSTEDLCQTLPILLMGKRGSFIEYEGYYYYQNPNSMTKALDSEHKIAPVAEQSSRSIKTVVSFAEKHGSAPNEIEQIEALAGNTIRWLLDETQHTVNSEWSRVINTLCRAYGPRLVIKECISRYSDFLQRYVPDPEVFPNSFTGQVQTIGVACQDCRGGGAERANGLWMHAIAATGRRVVWYYDEDRREAIDRLSLPANVKAIPLSVLDTRRRSKELMQSLVADHVDTMVLLDHWRPVVFWDLLLAKCHGCRTVVAEHSSFMFPLDDVNPALYIQRGNFYRLADIVTVLSPENVAWWHALGMRNVVFMPNLLTFDDIGSGAAGCTGRSGIIELLFVGRICVRKNPLAVLEAFKLFRQGHPDVASRSHLTFLGRYESDSIREMVETAVARGHFGDSVTFTGEVTDVASYYRRATLLLVASRLEGAPMTIMEAKSYGVPTVMFELPYVVGTTERDGVVTVPYGDAAAMAEAIYSCVTDKTRYQALCTAATTSLDAFGSDKIMARWERVFDMLESGPGEVDPMCEVPDASRMLPMTMQCLERLAPVLNDWWTDMVNREWHAREGADAAKRELTSVKQVAIGTRNSELYWMDKAEKLKVELEDSRQSALGTRNSELYWIAEAQRLANSRSYCVGRAVTWPWRMAHAVGKCYRENGLGYTLKRIPRKFANLGRKFFG